MKTKKTSISRKVSRKQSMAFVYYAPQAEVVALAGSFNDWDPNLTPMKKNKKGEWEVTLELGPGRYEYRYYVDGDWQNDQRPMECVPNAFGTWNCVIEIQ